MFRGPRVLASALVAALLAATPALADGAAAGPGPAQGDTLVTGEYLRAGGVLQTADSWQRLVMQDDGNLVLYVYGYEVTSATGSGYAYWASGTAGNPGAYAALQTDGNLVVSTRAGRPLWSSGTEGQGADRLVLQSDANLVLYARGQARWYTGGPHPPASLSGPGYAWFLESPDRRFSASLGEGITIVDAARARLGLVLWYVSCLPQACSRIVLQDDGNLVVYRTSGGVGGAPAPAAPGRA